MLSFDYKAYEFLYTGGGRSFWIPCILLNRYNDGRVRVEYFDDAKDDTVTRVIDESLLTIVNS